MISPKFLEHKTALKRASNPSAKAPKPKHVKPKKALKLITFREKLDNAQVTLARQIIQTQVLRGAPTRPLVYSQQEIF
jgi:hypothetical protein